MNLRIKKFAELFEQIERTVEGDRALCLIVESLLIREELDALVQGIPIPERTSERIRSLAADLRQAGITDLSSILSAETEGIERLRAGDPELLDSLGLTK